MTEGPDIIQQFKKNIDNELQLCLPAETPNVCAQLKEPGNFQKIKELVSEKVIKEKIAISAAIAAIEAELSLNSYID